MKVVQAITSGGAGGGQRVALEITAYLRALGHDVLVASPSSGPLFESLTRSSRGVILRFTALRDPRSVIRVMRCIASYRPDLLHTHLTSAGNLVWRLAALATGVPLVQHIHAANYFGGGGWKTHLATLLDRVTTRIPKIYIAVSDHTAQGLISSGYPAERIRVVRNGVRVEEVSVPPKRRRQSMRFACVARLSPPKGQLELIRAFKRAFAGRQEVELWVVGADLGSGEYAQALRREVADAGLERQVTFWGHHDSPGELMKACDALVLFSQREALPVVLLEAMSAGLPVIATRLGGVPEIVADGVSGLLVEPGDETALSGAMERLESDSRLRMALGAAGRQMVSRRFRIEETLKGIRGIYAELDRTVA